ncbi:MAG: KpsF/GutQ family sugar-phosphate isomerase [Candidatus Marinimicrobia bacterium]|nr:KpsF/GutQ family sugar-phosphate isomerase [Candidatus Neomarinimicrobiota bacterium]MBT4369558.1 KpsF/GutQ family sugar-phosphate isomerase [Candidatus Neomarinimicrobiota bacterium]MBT4661637.1 KpsF/GutQ family sugar-phosphate isomerase [Candidatus Neomarinimicrobiota bacterium]MBT5224202.1 KpsF/GutQ family sugar-phosphate isomerase [Candidatus Neomarinimicrobiota bacterium]MBT5721133.1 KpsF/GutQ family sugar-phosphate isomerase [Candidatus Neomarinimicrobiota bacterium]
MKSLSDIKKIARETIAIELAAVAKLESSINDDFVNAINLILSTKGRLIVAGIGKSANIANKMVATFNSTGQPAVFLHAADAIHGDLGNIQEGDVVICISKSGNTSEVKALVPFIKNMGNKIIALTGDPNSFLAIKSDFILDVSVEKEACPNNLAPTSSTTAQLVMGDAIAVSLLACKDFTEEDFARFHPGGILGKRLNIKVQDLISDYTPKVNSNASINEVIIEISQNRLGVTAVLNDKKLAGIITDGDLRRMLENEKDISSLCAKDIMSCDPKITKPEDLAYNALKEMEQNNITQLIVIKSEKYLGVIHIHDIIKEGIISQ